MKALMPTVTMPVEDWADVITAVASAQHYYARSGQPKKADQMELVGRQIARSCRHQARDYHAEKAKGG